MITINLLPPELRPVERTPLPRLLVVLIGVALAGTGLVFLIFMHLILLPRVGNAVAQKTEQVANLQQLAGEHQALVRELQSITQRETALKDIYRSRTIWWKKLDMLCDLVPSYVGLTSLGFKQARPAGVGAAAAEAAGTLSMECLAAKAEEKRVAAFRRILKGEVPPEWGQEPEKELGKEFIADFVGGEIADSGWRVEELTDFPDELAIRFTLEMDLKSKTPPAQVQRVGAPAGVPAAATR